LSAGDRAFHRGRARDAFLRAAAALTDPPTVETLAFAIIEGARGLFELVKLDEDQAGHAMVVRVLDQVRDERKDDTPNVEEI
jgi:hypothetical protein